MKVVFIIAQKDFRDEELFDTKEVLEQNGVEVKIAAPRLELAIGKLGGRVEPEFKFDEIEERLFDALILIGGPGAFAFIDDPLVHELVKDFYNANKLVAAICIAPAILARAGILKGKKATVHVSGLNYLEGAGALLSEEDVEVQGNIITANGPAAASRFGQQIVRYLESL